MEAVSDHGMDAFWYTMFMRPWPTDNKIDELRGRLWQLLEDKGPEKVASDVVKGRLVESLGLEFGWVVLPARIERGPLSRVTGWPKMKCCRPGCPCSAF